MQEESLQPITVGAFYGLQCPRPFLLARENPPTEKGPDNRKPPSIEDSPYCALAGQNAVFLGTEALASTARSLQRQPSEGEEQLLLSGAVQSH